MPNKKKVVYFLGAGCSYNFGYPLTSAIMPNILINLKNKDLFQLERKKKTRIEEEQENQLKYFLELLYPGLRGIDLEEEKTGFPSIVEVLSFVEHLHFYSMPPHPELDEEKLMFFRYLLNRAVAELMMDYQNESIEKGKNSLLKKFIALIKEDKKISDVTIITTNYDLTIDSQFEEEIDSNQVDYGIPFRHVTSGEIVLQPINPLFKYYKLHGSLNWLKCDLCGYYYINPYGSIAFNAFKDKIDEHNTCDCNNYLKLKTVLVTPSIVRDIRDSNLLQVWKASTEAIRTADKLIFIGYSLPPEDLAIKALIMRGVNGRNKKNPLAVDVVQLGEAAKPNYINLFGKSISYYKDGLSAYLQLK